MFENKKLIYICIPKAANSSIKKSLSDLLNSDVNIEKEKDVQFLSREKIGSKDLVFTKKDYFKFTCVRNPFSRIVSCYKNKFIEYKKRDGYFYFKDYLFGYFLETDSFSDFIYKLEKIPDRFSDRHFMSQYRQLHIDGKCVVDRILYMESINTGYKEIIKKYGVGELPHFNKTEKKESYMERYTPELVEVVYKRYKKDVHEFGYYNNYLELLSFVNKK